jgi:hypothetical protein
MLLDKAERAISWLQAGKVVFRLHDILLIFLCASDPQTIVTKKASIIEVQQQPRQEEEEEEEEEEEDDGGGPL